MGIIGNATAALLGRSTYQAPPKSTMFDLDSSFVQRIRRTMNGQLTMASRSRPRWFLADLELAEAYADNGVLELAASLMQTARKDGVLSGVLSTRTGGLVRLPRRFVGDPEISRMLDVGGDSTRSLFDEMFPAQELSLMAADGVLLGVAVGELLPVEGREHPVLVRLDPRYLRYNWAENRWLYSSIAGLIPITPGDGQWILHTPGGRIAPWNNALWRAVGKAIIRKEHANLHKDNWEAKLANPARVAVAPSGASELQSDSWFRQVMAWGVNSVFAMKPGFDVRLLESNGRGWECFRRTIEDQNTEMIIAVAGQTVTTDGGAGFQNSDIHKTIRADLIKETADALAHTLNTQGIPVFISIMFGVEAIEDMACVMHWDVTPPKDRNSEAQSLVTLGQAMQQLGDAMHARGIELDVSALCERYGIPVVGDTDGDGAPDNFDDAAPGLRLVPKPDDSDEPDEDEEEAA